MSDTTQTTATPATPANPLEALTNLITEKTAKANAIADEAKSALGNTARDIKDARETSEDEKVKAFRAWYEQHQAALNAALEEINKYILSAGIVKGASWDEKTAEAKKAEHKDLVKNIKEAKSALATTYKAIGWDMPEFPEVKNFSGSVSKSGTTGVSRPRFDGITLNGVALVGKGASGRATLSQVSQEVKSKTGKSVSASDLLDMLAKEAGVDKDNLVGMNDTTVEFTETDKDGVNHTFTLTVFKAQETDDTEAKAEDEAK